jgi:hypothetical protein
MKFLTGFKTKSYGSSDLHSGRAEVWTESLLSTFKTSFVKIRSKEIIGRTTGRKCCNRHLQKVQGLERRLESRIKQPVLITVVWH